MARKLYIYDNTTEEDRDQADGRFDADDQDIYAMPVGSIAELEAGLDRLVRRREVFHRILFQTHGKPGIICLGDDVLYWYEWEYKYLKRDYDKLLPTRGKVYFDGCNVAEDEVGSTFLLGAGKVFLKGMGGVVIGWTSAGYGFAGWVPFIGGHTVHVTGRTKRFEFEPGGGLTPPSPPASVWGGSPRGKDHIGNKI